MMGLWGKKSIATPPVIKNSDIARGYQKRPSIASYLPWRDYNERHKVFLLEDNQSLAVCFRITPIACEARPQAMMEAIAKSLQDALQNAIPCEKTNPWILQLFVQREQDLSPVIEKIKQAIPAERHTEPLVQAHLETLQKHIDYVTRPGGVFFDQQVTQQIFRGGILKVYAVLYRRNDTTHDKNQRRSGLEAIQNISRKLAEQWRACGLGVKRLTGEAFYRWLMPWFNPCPKQTAGNVTKLLSQIEFPKDKEKPFGWDLSEQLFFSAPESFEEGWQFDNRPHKVITIQNLSSEPAIGHLTAERKRGTDDKVFNLIDHLPEGSVFSLSIVFQAQSEVELHLKLIHDSAVGRHALAMKVKGEIEEAEQAIANGDYLLPTVMAVYIQGETVDQLHEREAHTEVLLNSNGFKVITDDELYPVDAYLRYLPMGYDFHFDKKNTYRSRYLLLSDIAKLLPVYGRSRGSENPGMLMFNRGGEPWFYDILQDRTKNAHFLLLGETGTGKSNTLNYLIMHNLALYNPRFFIIDAGGSFDLLADYCQSLGLQVHKIKIDPKNPVPLNPFAEGLKVLDQIATLEKTQREQWLAKADARIAKELEKNTQPENNEIDDDSRDILGDMVLAALVMITGGEKKEEDRIRRSDRMLIMDAIILAAETVKAAGRPQMIASDIVAAFERLILELNPERDADKIRRGREMADSLRYFIRDPVSSEFFNTPGNPWPTADITVVDFGLFAQEGYEAQRSIAFCGVFGKIQTLAEANQYSNRPLISVLDENHIFSKLPLLAAIETRGTKMGRKLGWWIWIATQNVRDFAEEARKMLPMFETWMCLAVPPDEIDQIERFKVLSAEQGTLFLSARKEKGKYTEGVLLSPKIQGLFRNVPPALYLAMAATEQYEKHQRRQLMQQLNLSELQVIQYLAEQRMLRAMEEYSDV